MRNSRAWAVVVGLSAISGITYGFTIASLGVFISPVIGTFGCSSEQGAAAASAFVLALTLASILVGWAIEWTSARRLMILGSACVVIAGILAGTSSGIGAFTVAMFLMGLGVGASTYVPSTVIITRWITEHLGIALGIFMSLTSVSAAALPVVVSHLISGMGWRGAMLCISASVVVIVLPILFFVISDSPLAIAKVLKARGGVLADLRDFVVVALASRAFWFLILAQILIGASFQGTYLFFVPYLTLGAFNADNAALIFGALNFATVPGYLVFGLVADRIGAKWALTIGICASAVSAPLLWISGASPMGIAAVAGFVLMWGATSSLLPQLTPMLVHEIVGDRHFSLAMGVNVLFFGLAMSAGPIFTGRLFDQSNSYIPAFQALAVLMALAVIPVLAIRSSKSATVATR